MTEADRQALVEFGRHWAAAEVGKDIDTLDAMAHPDLRLVGPLGFVLDRDAWLHRYRSGDLDTTELVWDQVEVRVFGDTAIAIGRQRQKVRYRGQPNDGDFRITHVFLREPRAAHGWLILSMHLSTMMTPPDTPADAATETRS